MARSPRLIGDGLVYHALNRGNNRTPVFFQAADYAQFLGALGQTRQRYPFRLYGYCLMSNHFHLVLEPAAGQSISRILQSLTVAHTWHYHKAPGATGWPPEGPHDSPESLEAANPCFLRGVQCSLVRWDSAGPVGDRSANPSEPGCGAVKHGLAAIISLHG
jgi:REP element-mobilizing transposase RayT